MKDLGLFQEPPTWLAGAAEQPLMGMGIGQRIAWLKRAIG